MDVNMETKLYFKHGITVAESGYVSVYEMDEELFLEIGPGHNLWALESEYSEYMTQLKNKPRGECLEIGLGLGVASRCIMTFPEVKHLTTVEANKDVIATHNSLIYLMDTRDSKWEPYDNAKHSIIYHDGLTYLTKTKRKFDFIFMDFYKAIDEDTLPVIKDMVVAAKKRLNKGGLVMGWLDPFTPPEDFKAFEEIFK